MPDCHPLNISSYSTSASVWALDPAIVYLNHGAFGACPHPVLQRQQELRLSIERNPSQFVESHFEPLLDRAKEALAAFVGARSPNLVFIANATSGVNTVLRSLCLPPAGDLRLGPGDEILTTDCVYNACRNALTLITEATGAQLVLCKAPFPGTSEGGCGR
jgi:isopenicillin-N epimerase